MTQTRRPSAQTQAVVSELADDLNHWWHGYELAQRTGLASGTLYPILIRLAERGILESKWEEPPGGRPPRHLYRITPDGVNYAATLRVDATIVRRFDTAPEAT